MYKLKLPDLDDTSNNPILKAMGTSKQLRKVQRDRANKTPSYSKISKDGNSVRLCIPSTIRYSLALNPGQVVSLSVTGKKLIIERVEVLE